MPSTPTTKSQVQAYRFVLRRMESALVRKDPVMLHDPMRGHKRATLVGVIVGVVGLAGFAIFGLFKPAAPVPNSGIVISQETGQIYVVSQQPKQIIPVFNMASARLLAYAESTANNSNSQGGQSGASSQAPTIAAPVMVDDSALKGFPTGRLTGIQDGPQVLPQPGSPTTTNWSVCDDIPATGAPNGTAGQTPQTIVLAGTTDIGDDLQGNQALLVSGKDGNTYLIYQRQHNLNNEDDSTVRAKIDMSDSHVRTALRLTTLTPRPISDALLNAIPEVGEIANPVKDVPTGQTVSNTSLHSGQAFTVHGAGGDAYYILLPDGYQEVSQTVAQIALFENSNETSLPVVTGNQLSSMPASQHQIDTSDYPDAVPAIFTPNSRSVMCLGWSVSTAGPGTRIAKTRVTVDTKLNLPSDSSSPTGQEQWVKIGQPDPSGDKITGFFMDPNYQGLVVHSVVSADDLDAGQIYIVTARGIKYSVPDLTTAQALGVANTAKPAYGMVPAPASIVGLLPVSAETLNTQNVQRTFDSVPLPVNAGTYTSVNGAQQASSGGGG